MRLLRIRRLHYKCSELDIQLYKIKIIHLNIKINVYKREFFKSFFFFFTSNNIILHRHEICLKLMPKCIVFTLMPAFQ